ncbi:helix-turn-helix domain-containing protein [Desulfococcus sp.]|uniref:helix-turn-helix domain-containing protein n=1 Tax=Desulfococcus sp. TaxID=2025834 RepID=UPI00359395B2
MSGKNEHCGSALEDFLKEEGICESAKAEAVARVIAWQIAEEMLKKGITKTQMAKQMHTSRAQVGRILKAKGNVTIETLSRAAALVGRKIHLELI